jgi:hypothetical protein
MFEEKREAVMAIEAAVSRLILGLEPLNLNDTIAAGV